MTSAYRQSQVFVGVLLMLAILAAGSVHGAPSDSIIYVKHDAVGSNNGSSWTDAYTDLQDALGIAQGGDEIWVGQGVYYPAPTAIDRTATFELVDGVALYGGFAGGENTREERDWEANVTVLSGDLDRDDGTDDQRVVTDTDNIVGDNAYRVVTTSWVTETAVLDGFIVTAGKADGGWPYDRGGGMSNSRSNPTLINVTFSGNSADSGGGMYNDHGSPTLTNVTFSGNQARSGAGMSNSDSDPTLTNVTFSGNRAEWLGGGMSNSNSDPTLTNVTFSGNGAVWSGGGMSSFYSDPALTHVTFSGNQAHSGGGMYNSRSNPTLTNVTFTGNQAEWSGGGMDNSSSNPTLTNVSFTGNLAKRWGGGMCSDDSSPTLTNVTFGGNQADSGGGMYNDDSSPMLVNCILWGNTSGSIIDVGDSNPALTYSAIEGGYPGEGNIDADPLFVAPISADQAPTTAGNYRLREDSPAIDAGTNSVVTANTDLDGNPRIVDGTDDGNAIVDMGAYEHQTCLLTIIKQGQGVVTSTPGPIDCGSVCTAGFVPGTVVTLTAAADPGWTFGAWTGVVDSIENPIEFTVGGDTVITATFAQEEYTLDVTVVGEGDVDLAPEQETYVYGDVVTLTATAQVGWTLEGWTGDRVSTDNPLVLTIQGDTELTATFTQDEYTLNVAIVGEGTVTQEPHQETYIYDELVTLTAAADPGWTFGAWSGDVDSTENPLDFTVEGDTVITATFTQDEYTLGVNVVGAGDVDIDPEQDTYVYGDVVTLRPAADPGWSFDAWSGPDAGDLSDNSDGSWDLVMDSDRSVTATFTQDEYSVHVAIVGEGDVDIAPEQDAYFYGDVVTLTATADVGWTFDGWTGARVSTDNPLQVTIQDNTTITATFTQDEYTLVLEVVGEGDIDVEPDQNTYHYGDAITLTATADAGWTFADWSGDVDSTENPLTLMMDADKTLTATFQLKTYVITPTAGTGGVITPSTPQTVRHGDDITFTIVADPEYHINDVVVDGVSQGAISSYSFINVTADHTISAAFALSVPAQFVSADHTAFFVGTSGVFIVEATGVPTPTITLTGVLPSSITFTDKGDGTATLSGTPGPSSAGVYPLVFTASNNLAPDATQVFTLTVKTRVYLPLVLTSR